MYTEGHSRMVSTGIYLPEEASQFKQLLENRLHESFDISYDWLDRIMEFMKGALLPWICRRPDMAVKASKGPSKMAGIMPTPELTRSSTPRR